MPKAIALRERSKRVYFSVHSNFPEQTAMVGILSLPLCHVSNFTRLQTGLCSELFAARTIDRTRQIGVRLST